MSNGTVDFLTKNNFSEPEEELEPLEAEEFPDSVLENLPPIMQDIISPINGNKDKKTVLFGAICLLSGLMPNIYFTAKNQSMYLNLMGYIIGTASAGKGVVSEVRHLLAYIRHEQKLKYQAKRKEYKTDLEDWKIEQRAYKDEKKKGLNPNPLREQPKPPPKPRLTASPDASSSKLLKILEENNERIILFETEGDTLATAFKREYSDYSTMLRKAFHHEPFGHDRRGINGEGEEIEIDSPKISFMLTSTHGQFLNLIPDYTENGLFSRIAFYLIDGEKQYDDIFEWGDYKNTENYYKSISRNIYHLWEHCSGLSNMYRIELKKEQRLDFVPYLDKLIKQWPSDLGATVKRMGIILFRIAAVLTVLRREDFRVKHNEPYSEKGVIPVHNWDYQTAFDMVHVFLANVLVLYKKFPKQEGVQLSPEDRRKRVKELKAEGVEVTKIANILQVSRMTIHRDLNQLNE